MVAAKVGTYTWVVVVVDKIDLLVARIECLCSVRFQHYYTMLPNCSLVVVVSQTTHWLYPYWVASVEICSWTLYVNKRL
jgi:hypothetical protein